VSRRLVSAGLLILTGIVAISSVAHAAPFGVGGGPGPVEVDGFTGWVLHQQSDFYRMLSGAIRAAKADGSATWALLGISFVYGVFHAAGPGHGKAVISSYLVANDETWKRGIALSFASAILQAITAVAVVGVVAIALGATSSAMGATVRVIEVVSYGLIVLIGLRLLWVKGRAFIKLLRAETKAQAHDHAHHDHSHGHSHNHTHNHGHGHVHGPACAHGHDHGDHDDEGHAWGHAHAPEPAELGGRDWWKRGLTAIVAVGLRPCSGAIIVLVFALAQSMFWTGVTSTFVMGLGTAITVSAIASIAVGARGLAGRLAKAKPGAGMLLLRGAEAAAAVFIVAFGALLLMGYMVSERMIGV
jgi:nickel/cobalt exporter